MSDIPQWAFERASKLAKEDGCAFARYIAEHEEPPVDPMLIEAREIAEQSGWSSEPDGLGEKTMVLFALKALRRGMELAKGTPET